MNFNSRPNNPGPQRNPEYRGDNNGNEVEDPFTFRAEMQDPFQEMSSEYVFSIIIFKDFFKRVEKKKFKKFHSRTFYSSQLRRRIRMQKNRRSRPVQNRKQNRNNKRRRLRQMNRFLLDDYDYYYY